MSARTVSYEPGYLVADKYELEMLLGEGGMGAVWRARNVALDAQVAIKVVRATGDRSALRARLLQEARAAAKLSHPAIVKVFDVGQTEAGDPFIVMELLSGNSLGTLLAQQGRLPSSQAVRILLPIVDALWFAHGKSIVHRDLKPDNIFIVQDEAAVQPKLVDFGIVKVQAQDDDGQLTQDGVVLGSPDYMSPEQARGQDDVDHLSDVWGMCVVLYEAIAGHPPFSGANYNALLRQIVESTPPSLKELSAADDELSEIVVRGLSKRREERFASMGELGRALARWLIGHGIHEDICGSTLEAKWLRSADPHGRPGRSTVSIADAWPVEGGSGVRPNALRPIETVPAPPEELPGGRVAPSVGRYGPRWLLPVGGAAVVAIVLLGSLLLRTPPQRSPASPPSSSVEPRVEVPPRDTLPAPSKSVLAPSDLPLQRDASETPALLPSGKVSSPPGRGTARAQAPKQLPKAKASGEAKSTNNEDLISPY